MVVREYVSDELTVRWDAGRCIHAARCLDLAPAVFDTRRRPWVDLDGGTTDEVVRAVDACPTGALSYRRADEAPASAPEGPSVSVTPIPGGPMLIRGRFRLTDDDDATVAEPKRAALCRCGNSGNQPFCDNSHRRVGFAERDTAVEQARREARAPDDICPRHDLPAHV